MGAPLDPRPAIDPPGGSLLRELAGVSRGLVRWGRGRRQRRELPRGAGQPVMVLPGFLTSDASTLLLRRFLRRRGYRVHGWGLGLNRGDVYRLLPLLVARIRALASAEEQPLRLVGWSLGGTLAREAAREATDAVDRVVTLGSPVVGGPKYTLAARYYERVVGLDLDAVEAEVAAMTAAPVGVPITAIYSRSDQVVSWEACLDRADPAVEHVEVDASHFGLGLDPQVLALVARSLAADAGPRAAYS